VDLASAAVQSATFSEIVPPVSAKEELDPPATTTDNSFDHYFLVFADALIGQAC
jgi:hypothetical protein